MTISYDEFMDIAEHYCKSYINFFQNCNGAWNFDSEEFYADVNELITKLLKHTYENSCELNTGKLCGLGCGFTIEKRNPREKYFLATRKFGLKIY